jgi:tetrathionate reductase subunit C
MDVSTLYNVFHQQPWGWKIATYFFLTGVSAGAFILSSLSYVFGMQRFKPIGLMSLVVAVVVLLIGPILLIADLTQPTRFWHLLVPTYWHFTSPMAWGSVLLIAYPVNCLLYAKAIVKQNLSRAKTLGIVGIPLAIAVHGYTGYILGAVEAKILWHTAMMPILFLWSAMVSGVALLILVILARNALFGESRLFPKVEVGVVYELSVILFWFILVDVAIIVLDIMTLRYGGEAAQEVLYLLLRGSYAGYFLGVELVLGAIVPIIILAYVIRGTPVETVEHEKGFLEKKKKLANGGADPRANLLIYGSAIASILVVVGVWFMRYNLVYAGQEIPLAI